MKFNPNMESIWFSGLLEERLVLGCVGYRRYAGVRNCAIQLLTLVASEKSLKVKSNSLAGSGRHMVERQKRRKESDKAPLSVVETLPLWQLDIIELTGHNLEARGREEVNRLLQEGWRLLHIYTLKYHEDEVWRERPMAILGKPRSSQQATVRENGGD